MLSSAGSNDLQDLGDSVTLTANIDDFQLKQFFWLTMFEQLSKIINSSVFFLLIVLGHFLKIHRTMSNNCSGQKNPNRSYIHRTPNFYIRWESFPEHKAAQAVSNLFILTQFNYEAELNLASGINREIYSLGILITSTAPTCFLRASAMNW